MNHIFGAVYGVLHNTIGDSAHLNAVLKQLASGDYMIHQRSKKQCNCPGKMNIIPVRLVLL